MRGGGCMYVCIYVWSGALLESEQLRDCETGELKYLQHEPWHEFVQKKRRKRKKNLVQLLLYF